MVAGTDLQLVILRLDSYDANCVVSSLWGGSSTFDLFQFTDKHSNPLAPRRQSLRISLRDHHHQIHGCIPCTLSFRATTTGVLANVRSTVGVGGGTGTIHMKQCFLAFRPLLKESLTTALTRFSSEPQKQKSHLQLPRSGTP